MLHLCGDSGTVPVVRSSAEWDRYAVELGHSLKRHRSARGLSQEQLAYEAGLSRYSYQKFEKGESMPGSPANPSLRNVMALAQVLGVTLDDLLPSPWPDLRAGNRQG